jgi:hypothetical protein
MSELYTPGSVPAVQSAVTAHDKRFYSYRLPQRSICCLRANRSSGPETGLASFAKLTEPGGRPETGFIDSEFGPVGVACFVNLKTTQLDSVVGGRNAK